MCRPEHGALNGKSGTGSTDVPDEMARSIQQARFRARDVPFEFDESVSIEQDDRVAWQVHHVGFGSQIIRDR